MAGHMVSINGCRCFVDYADAVGQAKVRGKMWRWEYHRYLGPTFLRKDGEPRACQNPNKLVWAAFMRGQKKMRKNQLTKGSHVLKNHEGYLHFSRPVLVDGDGHLVFLDEKGVSEAEKADTSTLESTGATWNK